MISGDSPLAKTKKSHGGEKSRRPLKAYILSACLALVGVLAIAVLIFGRKASAKNPALTISQAQLRLKNNPEDLKALVSLGIDYFEEGPNFYPQGINALEEARSLGSLDPRIFYYRGLMYQNLGFYPFALKEYQRYLRNFNDDEDIRQREAKLLFQAGRYNDALAEYQRLSYFSPKDPVIKENLALCLWKNHEENPSAEIFSELAKTSSPAGVKRAEFYLGRIAESQKDYQGALGHFLKAVPAENEDIGIAPQKIYFFLAHISQKLGHYRESQSFWKKTLSLDPRDSQAKKELKKVRRFLLAQKRRKRRHL